MPDVTGGRPAPAADGTPQLVVPPPVDGLQPLAQRPRFSVVVAAHNAERSVRAAVLSALHQSEPPLEVVVVDDGSTDGTAAVLDELAGLDERVRVFRRANGGEAAAKNAAVSHARAEFVVVLDADDLYLPGRLAALGDLARDRPDLDVLVTDAWLAVDGRRVRRAYDDSWTFPAEDQREAILRGNFVLGLAAVRRRRWLELGGFDEALHHATDWDFFLRAVHSGSRAGLVHEPLAVYQLGHGSLSSARLALAEGRLATLTKAAATADLTPSERSIVATTLVGQQREVARRRLEASLSAGDGPQVRRAAWGLLRAPAAGRRLRLRLLAAAPLAAPGLSTRALRQRRAGTVEVASGMRIPTDRIAPTRPVSTADAVSARVPGAVVLHAAELDGTALRWPVEVRPLVGPPDVLLAAVTVDGRAVGEPGEPPDATVARLCADGGTAVEGAPVPLADAAEALALARAQGAAAVPLLAVEPALLPRTRLGAWPLATWSTRARRRALMLAPRLATTAAPAALDAAFWSGVRSAATAPQWRRLTRSYVALNYHRIAGERRPGQERLDLSPRSFARQMALLRLLRYRTLGADEVIAFHRGGGPLPRRAVVVTLDDGYLDAVTAAASAARRHRVRPHLYVPSHTLGGLADWADDVPLADADEVHRAVGDGAVLGAHGRRHRPLPSLSDEALIDEVEGSLTELRGRRLPVAPLLAYPNGQHDERVRATTVDSGYALAWTTVVGRNGAGTDPWCLRRIGVKAWDTLPAFLWKLMTGEHVPAPAERVAVSLWTRSGRRGSVRVRRVAPAAAVPPGPARQ